MLPLLFPLRDCRNSTADQTNPPESLPLEKGVKLLVGVDWIPAYAGMTLRTGRDACYTGVRLPRRYAPRNDKGKKEYRIATLSSSPSP